MTKSQASAFLASLSQLVEHSFKAFLLSLASYAAGQLVARRAEQRVGAGGALPAGGGARRDAGAALWHRHPKRSAGVGYTYDFGCFGTTISAIFRPFSAVFGAFSPSWRQEAGQREKTAKERRKGGQKRGRNSRI